MNKTEEICAVLEDTEPPIDTALELLRTVCSSGSNDDVIAALGIESILTREILSLSNSSIYNLSSEMVSLSQTVAYLGGRTLVRLVVSVCASPFFERYGGPGSVAAEEWRHAVACGIAAQLLSEMKGCGNPSAAFTAGVLHDIGRLPLLPYIDRESGQLWDQAQNSRSSLSAAERQVLGINHAAAGARLARHWGLPEAVCRAIRYHHEPETGQDDDLAHVVHVADVLTLQLGFGANTEGMRHSVSEESIRRLHVQSDETDRIRLMLLEELSRSQDLLKLPERHGR